MNFCIYYNRNSKNCKSIEKVNEITIDYYNTKDFVDLLNQFKEKRINIYIRDKETNQLISNEELKKIKIIHETYPDLNLYLEIPINTRYSLEDIKDIGLPYFLEDRINDIDLFTTLLSQGVSDIYVVENLCFELDKISEVAHSRNVRLRTFPNVAQSESMAIDGLLKFFIRPEDIDVYSQYIDTFEFFGDERKQDVLYDIYNSKVWNGPLNEIIIGLNSDLDSRFILPQFGESRVKCGKRCLKGGNCRICNRIEELSKTLKENDIVIKNK